MRSILKSNLRYPQVIAAIVLATMLVSLPIPVASAQTTAQPDAKAAPAPKLTPKEVRDAEIAEQAQQLYQLAQELKAEVDKSNKDTLSLAVMKKAAEIEKLARALKQNMRAN